MIQDHYAEKRLSKHESHIKPGMNGNFCSTNGSRHVVFVFVFTCNTCFQFVICLIPLDNIVFGLDLISNMSLYICYFKIVQAAALVFIRDLHI